MRSSLAIAHLSVIFFTAFAALSLWFAHEQQIVSERWALVLYTTLLVGFLLIEVLRVRALQNHRWLINPVVMCSLLTFVLGFGVTNILYFLPDETVALVGMQADATPWMNKLMALVLLGAIAMWVGYWLPFSMVMARRFRRGRWLNRVLRLDWSFRPEVMIGMVLLSLASRLIAIRLGVYGYSSDNEQLMAAAGFTQYLSMAEGLGKLALVVAALRYFSPDGCTRGMAFWLWGLLGYEILFGFLSGFKSQVAMPFVIVGICYYLRLGRIPWRWIALVPVALMLAYAVIEPFRVARYADTVFTGTSLSQIATVMMTAASGQGGIGAAGDDGPGTPLTILARTNLTYIASMGLEYADRAPMPEDAPNFLLDIFLAPLYAVLPRGLFEFKPANTLGLWYYNEVMGVPGFSSVGMSPFTYLYFAGGALAVALGFFFVGIAQRAMAEVFLASPQPGAAIPFLVLLPTLAVIDSVFYSTVISLLRMLPLALLLQYMIFRR